ncbi:MAG: ImmA/IrrE family metallo-endopeptidase [Boseongicola sp. SB0673_bin_14]|nr:ImmA/IrrE family metallo-endopeptidase [Boseongicola sp. SB0667_bin_21]MYI69932.1 ImmA/IrrE family metallo-endopeptidase [Boseongicola sp. SB0673_bin_14]
MTRVPVNPELLSWARERAGVDQEDLAVRFKKLPEWETGQTRPTLKQVEAFARTVHVPIGYLFLSEPPEESLPIPDFRTLAGHAVTRPSPNLLDTVHACQERQSWYRNHARVAGEPDLGFVGSSSIEASPESVAIRMRETLEFDLAARRECSTWSDALRLFIRRADDAGVLVMVSGIVMSNSHRSLDPAEFRGFALCDPLAPLIFVNGKDTKAAQMFTLAHELAHVWLGATALSNLGAAPGRGFRKEEVWCNAVAAELLVPLDALRSNLRNDESLPDAQSRLARTFKVSTLVILRRLLDAGWLTRERFDAAWTLEHERLRALAKSGNAGGGDFHRTTIARVGRRFARALVVSTLEGQTLYRDAFRMLGVKKTETFNSLGREAGVTG